MISSEDWRAYNDAVDRIAGGAAAQVESEVLAWCGANPGASVAECREAAKEIMSQLVQAYDEAAAALAAEWYDMQGDANGARLDRAVTSAAYSAQEADGVARYKASKLVKGDAKWFAAECGAFAANSAMRSLNDTIIKNVKRDKKKGVRYARVTSGRNTCAFCLMLAGRGAVYWTRESAGALNRWHNHCTCKVVPSYSGDAREVLVEGHDPAKIEARLKEVERLTGAKRGTPEFSREVSLHDPDWLFGDEAMTDYSLNPIENYGTLVKPGDYSPENIVDRGNEWRDLWAHHVLENNGYKVTVRPPEALDALGKVMDGVTCPDLFIGDEIWEVKSPPPRTVAVKPGNELKFINSQMRSADKNFRNPYDVEVKAPMPSKPPTRVILNVRYVGDNIDISSDAFASKLMAEMKQFNVREVMAIDAKGRIVRYKKSA